MHKSKYIMDTTDDPRIYRSALKEYRANEGDINCPLCAYHPRWKSTNYKANENFPPDRNYKSWKTKRKHQYRFK